MKWAYFCVGALLTNAIVHWPDVIAVGTAQKTLHVVSNADITDPYDVIPMAVKMHERTDAAIHSHDVCRIKRTCIRYIRFFFINMFVCPSVWRSICQSLAACPFIFIHTDL